MNKFLSIASSAALFAMTSLGGIAPSMAAQSMMQHPDQGKQQQFVMSFCDKQPTDPDCHDFSKHSHNWSSSQYQNFYHRHSNAPGFGAAASIFGFVAGAALAGAANAAASNQSSDHVRACENAYHSYDPSSDTYLGYDGQRHQCTL